MIRKLTLSGRKEQTCGVGRLASLVRRRQLKCQNKKPGIHPAGTRDPLEGFKQGCNMGR